MSEGVIALIALVIGLTVLCGPLIIAGIINEKDNY